MELKQIKELMTAMERGGIKKLVIKENNGFELQLERQEVAGYHVAPVSHPHKEEEPAPHHARVHSHPQIKTTAHIEPEKPGRYVISPMVGTYYTAPSPDDPPFVKVGDRVDENTVVCIIEAMKVMNEVKAGISGVIAEFCVENAHPVEFGTKLLRIV